MLNMLKIWKGHFKKVLETREMLKMLEVFWVLTSPPKKNKGGGKTQKTFNIFNISPVQSFFFVGMPFKFLTVLTFPLWEAFFQKNPPPQKRGETQKTLTCLTFPQWEAFLLWVGPLNF